jgi:hypothetical protein
MRMDKEMGMNGFSREDYQKRYDDELANLQKHFLGNDYGRRNDIEGYLNAVNEMNADYTGQITNKPNHIALQSGAVGLTQGEMGNHPLTVGGNASTIAGYNGNAELGHLTIVDDRGASAAITRRESSSTERTDALNPVSNKRTSASTKEHMDAGTNKKADKKVGTTATKSEDSEAHTSFNEDGAAEQINVEELNDKLTPGNYDGLKQFIAIAASEAGATSTDPFTESQAIGEVMMRRMDDENVGLDEDFISKIGGAGQYNVLDGKNVRYNTIMSSSWQEILSSTNPLNDNIRGAIHSFLSPEDNVSKGAFFWTAQGNSWSNGLVRSGVFTETNSIGRTQFFKYTDPKKTWP